MKPPKKNYRQTKVTHQQLTQHIDRWIERKKIQLTKKEEEVGCSCRKSKSDNNNIRWKQLTGPINRHTHTHLLYETKKTTHQHWMVLMHKYKHSTTARFWFFFLKKKTILYIMIEHKATDVHSFISEITHTFKPKLNRAHLFEAKKRKKIEMQKKKKLSVCARFLF